MIRQLPPASSKARWLGFLTVLAYSLVTYLLIFFTFEGNAPQVGVFAGTAMFPIGLGVATQAFYDPARILSGVRVWGVSVAVVVVLSCILLLFQLDTLICILIALPIMLPLQFAGVYLARWVLDKLTARFGQTPTRLSAITLPVILAFTLPAFEFPESVHTVESRVIITAKPDTIWQHTLSIPEIQPSERIFTLSHNLLRTPKAHSAVFDGKTRHLRWTRDITFEEIPTLILPNERLEWVFNFDRNETLNALDPHISPNSQNVRLLQGIYALKPLGSSHTELILQTRYKLRTPINGYLSLWGRFYLNDFHNSVLHVIKSRSETAPKGAT